MTIDNLNKFRYKIIIKYIILLCMLLMFIITIAMMIKYNAMWTVAMLGILIVLSFCMCWHVDNCHKKYGKMFREYISSKIYSSNVEDIYYESKSGMSQSKIYKSNLLRIGNHYDSQYHLSGKINDIAFEQTYAKIYDVMRHSADDRRRYDYIFDGKWLIFYLNRTYESNIQIINKTFGGAVNNWVKHSALNKDIFGRQTKKDKYQKYKTQNDKFNKKFNIFVDSETNFELSETLIQNIYELNSRIKGKLIISFINNELHIGIQKGKNNFKPKNVLLGINEQAILDDINNEINFIKEIVEYLIKNM